MKVALITDIHWGVRNDSKLFLELYEQFFEDKFFPYLEHENIKTVINLGDTFDRRKYSNHGTIDRALKSYYDKIRKYEMNEINILGNHDIHYRNTLAVNTPNLVLGNYFQYVDIVNKPRHEIFHDGTKILLVPWICQENAEECYQAIKESDAKICMGHFEIAGFVMFQGRVSEHGLDKKMFDKFDMTFSGHFHHKSTDGNIFYLGNPFETTWADYDDPKGFHIFDTETHDLKFVQNPNKTFHKIIYDDRDLSMRDVDGLDFSIYKNSYVKVVALSKGNPWIFENYLEKLYAAEPADLSIVENFIDVTDLENELDVDQAQDTPTIVDHYIDNIKIGDLDPEKLKALMRDVYMQSISVTEPE